MNKHSLLRAALTGAAVIITLANAPAADKTWDGGGGNNNWNTPTNWTDNLAPVANDVLIFDGAVRLAPNNNYTAGTQFNGLIFAAGASAFNLTGSAITLGGNITNASSYNQTNSQIAITNTGAMEINTGAAGITFINTGTKITSAFTVTKTGSGTLSLVADNNNALSNNFIINEGTLINAGTGAAPFGTEYTVMANGTAVGASSSGVVTASKGVKIANNATVTFLSLTAGVTNTLSTALFGDASYGQGVTLVKSGAGILRLSSATTNANFGITTASIFQVDQGTLYTSSGDSCLGAVNNRIVLNGGTYQMSGSTLGSSRTITLNAVAGNTLKPDDATTFIVAAANQLTGSGGFTKTGAGTLTIGAAQNYSGKTTIAAGALSLSNTGSISNSSEINLGTAASQGTLLLTNKASGYTFGSAQTVSGYGAINIGAGKTVTIQGTLAPGNSAGIITNTGNLTLDSTAAIVMELAGTGGVAGTDYDQLQVSGTFTLGGALTITNSGGFNLTNTGSYTLFTAATKSGNFTSVNVAGDALTWNGGSTNAWIGIYGGSTTYTLSDGVLTAAAVPEPSTLAMLGLSGLALAAYRLRRRSR